MYALFSQQSIKQVSFGLFVLFLGESVGVVVEVGDCIR